MKLLRRICRVIWTIWAIVITATLILLIAGIAILEYRSWRSIDPDKIRFMPAPDIYAAGIVNPFDETRRIELPDDFGVFYATGRQPAKPGDGCRFYGNERGHVIRLGVATVWLDDKDITWEEAKRISLMKDRGREYPLHVNRVHECGVLEDTLAPFAEPAAGEDLSEGGRAFAKLVNEKLALSHRKDVYVYVHGYKVLFENPLLVAAEFWHYLGYDGAFIAYAWPATPAFTAYFSDLETATHSSRDLRILLAYLARETDAERIHVIGYSAGTRLVLGALHQLALLHAGESKEQIAKRYRIGQVILVGSDMDRAVFGNLVADGICDVPARLTVYLSQLDNTLGMSRFVFRRKRLGQLVEDDQLTPGVAAFLREEEDLIMIDVSRAENVAANSGHAYFRKSPWVSSDLLLALRSGRAPGDRGLVPLDGTPLWEFPDDYLEQLRTLGPGGENEPQ